MPTRQSWLRVLPWFAGTRLIIVLLGLTGVATFVDQRSMEVGGPLALHLPAVWNKWDVQWYERIAVHGYDYQLDDVRGQAAAGFFPLYPTTIGVLLKALPVFSFFWMGTLVSNLFTFIALAIAVEHLSTGIDQARRMLLITLASAGSFYLSIPYTESLFLLLVVLVMVLTRHQRYFWAAFAAGLAATTRVQGLALIAIPVIACRLDLQLPLPARFRRIAVMAVLFAVPLAIYFTYLSIVHGNAEVFIARQDMWDNRSPYPLKSLIGLFQYPRRLQGWLHGAFWGVYVVLLLRYWRRLPLGEALFCAGALVISTQQESFHGIYRYMTPLMPLTLALANDHRNWRQPILIGNIIFGVVMILAFVTWNRLAV